MLKLIGAILVIGASTGMGFTMSSDLKQRIEELKYLKKIMMMLQGEIKYVKAPLPEAFSNISIRVKPPFAGLLEAVSEEMNSLEGSTFIDIWDRQVKQHLGDLHLNKNDLQQLIRLGENFGYLDGEMQLGTIGLYMEQLEMELKTAQESIGIKTRLYSSLGVMGGLAITIIIL